MACIQRLANRHIADALVGQIVEELLLVGQNERLLVGLNERSCWSLWIRHPWRLHSEWQFGTMERIGRTYHWLRRWFVLWFPLDRVQDEPHTLPILRHRLGWEEWTGGYESLAQKWLRRTMNLNG